MKNTAMKKLAAVGISLCLMAGAAVPVFADGNVHEHHNVVQLEKIEATCTEEGHTAGLYCKDCKVYVTGGEVIAAKGHDWEKVEETRDLCYDVDQAHGIHTVFHYKKADGTVEEIDLCAICGKENGKQTLKQVNNVFSNFGNLRVFSGKLANGMQVLTVGFYNPDQTTKKVCKTCGQQVILDHVDGHLTQTNEINATFDIPTSLLEGYTPMLVNADGTETELAVTKGEKRTTFTYNMAEGTRLIHLVPNN